MSTKYYTADGAIDLNECPRRAGRCRCEICLCGQRKHMAVHGPLFGQPPGSKPYRHAFQGRARMCEICDSNPGTHNVLEREDEFSSDAFHWVCGECRPGESR